MISKIVCSAISLLSFSSISIACSLTTYENISSHCIGVHSQLTGATTWLLVDGEYKYRPLPKGHSWRGKWRDGRPIGYGIYKVEEEYEYIGMTRNAVPNGDGKLIIKSKNGDGSQAFVGFFSDGHINGTAKVYARDWIYEGEVKKTIIDGVGKMTLSDGTRFFGKFVDNQFDNGLIKYSNGDVYGGSAVNFKPHDENGAIWYDNFDRAFGKFEDGWQVSGNLRYADLSEYEGEFLHNLPHGIGKTVYTDGSYTEGNYFDGDFVEGIFWKNGTEYTGIFGTDLKLKGEGQIKHQNGDTYEGEVKENLPHGNGIATYANLAFEDTSTGFYVGAFVDGVRSGQGEMDYGDGRKYQGEFIDNKPNGNGSMAVEGESYYSGEWVDGEKDGVGYYFPENSGWNYFGHFKGDIREGFGVLLATTPEDPDTAQIGYWENNKRSGKTLDVFLNKKRAKFCTPIPNKKRKCVSNNPFEWKIPIREYFFENDYLAPNLKYAFFKLSQEDRENISKYNHLNLDTFLTENGESSWSVEAFAWLASLAAVQYGSFNINEPELVRKVIAYTVEMSNNLSNGE